MNQKKKKKRKREKKTVRNEDNHTSVPGFIASTNAHSACPDVQLVLKFWILCWGLLIRKKVNR